MVAGCLCLLASLPLPAQAPATTRDPAGRVANQIPAATVQAGAVALPAESIGPDDLLEIMVPYCPELSRTFRVGSDGSLALPLLKHPIAVSGMLPVEVGEQVKEALQRDQILNDPVVTISVIEYRSRPVSVIGAVNHPLTFQAVGETTLLDAIARAGGLAPSAGTTILVTRRVSGSDGSGSNKSKETLASISASSLLASSDPEVNLRLHGGEEIRVPETGKIFVAGNVRRPGMYAMQSDMETTVVKALALSEGLQPYSANVAYIYRRRGPGEERREIKVPLSRIMSRKDMDVALLSDDILFIPENGGKKMTSKVLNQIAGFGQTTATGLLIYR